LGRDALRLNTTASNNTAVGYQAVYTNTTGTQLVAVGQGAMYSNTTGNYNSAVGQDAMYSNTTGAENTALGRAALKFNTTGSDNVAVGYNAGNSITTGGSNTIVGASAASSTLTTGSRNTYVGYGLAPSGAAVTDEIIFASGSGATGKGSSTGFINPATGGVYQGNNAATWSVTSDRRLKKNIVDNNIGLEKIAAIQVRNFEYRLPEEVDAELKPTVAIQKEGVQLGAIAQELQQVLPDCVKTESTGVMSVNSDNLTWYLINAVKELKAEVDSLKSQLNQGA